MYVHVLHMYSGAAVSGSARLDLEGDKSRFQRMPSVDSFNQVGLHHAQIIFASNFFRSYVTAALNVSCRVRFVSLSIDYSRCRADSNPPLSTQVINFYHLISLQIVFISCCAHQLFSDLFIFSF